MAAIGISLAGHRHYWAKCDVLGEFDQNHWLAKLQNWDKVEVGFR
jgi:hypothetical protein